MSGYQVVPVISDRTAATIARLRDYANEAIKQYSAEIAGGGEPPYPQWAGDILELLLLTLCPPVPMVTVRVSECDGPATPFPVILGGVRP